MGRRWGRVDIRDFKKLQKRLDRLARFDVDAFILAVTKALAGRLMRRVIKRTPVGQYKGKENEGKIGGTLRRGWTAQTEEEAETSPEMEDVLGAQAYVNSLEITKSGGVFTIQLINPVNYASYVEFGHRTANHKGWVNGHFMLTISEKEIEDLQPALIERMLYKKLSEAFGD